MGAELGWDDDRRAVEADAYLATATREYGIAPSPSPQESAPEPALAAPPVTG
jgi:hypothetical protein